MSTLHPAHARRAGFTLIELLVSVGLVGALLAAVALTTRTASRSYEQGRHREQLGTRADRVLARLAAEFGDAERTGLLPEPLDPWGSSFLSYRHAAGFQDDEVVWGPTTQVGLELAPGELANGLDDNSDGLADEHELVSITNVGLPDESRTVWVRGVAPLLEGEVEDGDDDNGNGLIDEQGLAFVVHGDVLTIRLTLQGVGPEGGLRTKSVETSVKVRN